MAALRSLAASHDLSVSDTLRFFYKLYPYRVTFDCRHYTEKALPASQKFRAARIHEEILADMALEGTHTARRLASATSLYFTDEADACAFLARVSGSALTVSAPLNAEAHAAITPDGSRLATVLKPHLWWGKYGFRVEFKDSIDTANKIDDVLDWIRRYDEVSPTKDRIEFQYGEPRTAYFADENDLLFFKLVFHEHISKLEKALLIKDFTDAREPAEGAH